MAVGRRSWHTQLGWGAGVLLACKGLCLVWWCGLRCGRQQVDMSRVNLAVQSLKV